MRKKPLTDKSGEVRELTKSDFRQMRPARDVVPDVVAAYVRSRGRPRGQSKAQVTLRLDHDLLKGLRALGSGWQTRVNNLLRAAFIDDRP